MRQRPQKLASEFAYVVTCLVAGNVFEFIAPLFTKNDEDFRLSSANDAEKKVLESNRYRIVSYYDARSNELLLATDQITLETYLGQFGNGTVEVTKGDEVNTKGRLDGKRDEFSAK